MGVASGGFVLVRALPVVFGMLALGGTVIFLAGAGCFTGSVSGSGMNAGIRNN